MPPGQSRALTPVGTADAKGNVTLTFPDVKVNSTFTGVVSVPSSTNGVLWAIYKNDVQQATRQGPSEYGPIQLTSSDVLTLVGSNAVTGSQYQGILVGSLDYAGAAPTQIVPTSAAVAAVVQPTNAQLLGSGNITANAGSFSALFATGTRTVIVKLGNSVDDVLLVEGTQSGFAYFNAIPYLVTASGFMVVVPISQAIDQGVTITLAGATGGTFAISVYGDDIEYDESIFYNGEPQITSITTTGALVNGPVRLLSIDLSTAASATATITIGGAIVSSATNGANQSHDFPQPFIVDPSESVAATISGTARAAVSFAYP